MEYGQSGCWTGRLSDGLRREGWTVLLYHIVLLLTLLGLQQLRALVQHLEEQLVPRQGAEDAESRLTVRSIPTEAKCPLSFQVGEDE